MRAFNSRTREAEEGKSYELRPAASKQSQNKTVNKFKVLYLISMSVFPCICIFTTCLPGALTSQECIRVSELELQMVLSRCMGAGNGTPVLCKGNKVLLTIELQFPEFFGLFVFV